MSTVEVGTYTFKENIFDLELKQLLERKDILIVPDKNSIGSRYRTELWINIQRYGRWRHSDDVCYQAHHFKDLRYPDDPISSTELEFISLHRSSQKFTIFQKISSTMKDDKSKKKVESYIKGIFYTTI